MAVSARTAKPVLQPVEAPLARRDAPFEMIARLAALHDEAAETTRLVRLLGRATYAALALGLSASVAAAHWDGALAPLLAWLILLGAGIIAVFYAYDCIASPFELAQLRARSGDLSAIMLYVGFAWGAGSFLVLAADASLGGRVIFAAGAGVLVTVMLRNVAFSACFLLPVAVLATVAALLQPGQGRWPDAAAVLGACTAVGLAGVAFERLFLRARGRNMAPYFPI